MGEGLRLASSIKPSTARGPAVSRVIGSAGGGCGRGRGGEGLFWVLFCVHPLCAPSRVKFRAYMLQQQKEERKAQELARQCEREERENQLEALRKQVGHYLLLTFPTTLIFSVSRNDPQGDPQGPVLCLFSDLYFFDGGLLYVLHIWNGTKTRQP